MLRFAIDIGGTFTDVVAETATGLISVKVLTTPQAPDQGALDGIDRLLRDLGKSYGDITTVVHGTTLATNALIERRGAKTAFVTTQGFRDVLEMRYEKRFVQYDLDIQMPAALVPRPLRFGLPERMLADGSALNKPQDADIDAIATALAEQDVQAVAIGFLHSYRNPEHEHYVADRLRVALNDDVTICQSAEVGSEIREYERFSTVCANAYVRPLMSRYLRALQDRLTKQGFDGSFLLMLSGGGLTTLDQAMRFPIRLLESGPAGGVAFAAQVAQEMGSDKTLSLDIGGTTAKICFISDGIPQTTRKFEVARAWRDTKGSGLPVRVPTVELVEIGAGGGSVSGVDTLGRLKVGPHSAGSDPGPASYGLGGTDPTITDAHLCIGNIAATGFAGGMIDVDPTLGQTAISTHVQHPLELDLPTAAAGIIELADETMANAARVHGIELGHDIAGFDLLVTGGGGALHAARIAEKLDIRRIIVPLNAGVGSAVGFLRSSVAFERAISVIETLDKLDANALGQKVADHAAQVRQIVEQSIAPDRIDQSIKAELRYAGQGLEITLDLGTDVACALRPDALRAAFLDRYKALVGFNLRDIAIELVSVTVTARERKENQPLQHPVAHAPTDCQTRQVYDLTAKADLTYQIIPRSHVPTAATLGPAAITEAQTTTLVRLGWSVQAAQNGHLILERQA